MRSRALGAVVIAGVVAFAGPAWSQGRGGGHGGSGHSSGGHSGSGWHGGHGGHGGSGHSSGGHSGSGWHGGHGGHGGHWFGHHPGFRFHGGGLFGWPGFWGWDSFWFGLPLWWDSYSAWGWPYQYYGYLGTYGYPDYGVATVPADPGTAAPGPSDTAELEPSEGAPAVTGPAPVELDVAPTGALVYLNGALIGSVNEFSGRPDYLYLDPGQYALEFRLPGYRTRTLPLTARGSGKILIALDLRAEAAGGGATGAPPSPGLPHGRRFGPSFGRESTPAQTPPGSPGNDQPASGATSASTALVLRISPPSAAVYVDGVLLGTGESLGRLPQGVAVSPGKHRVDVVAPGHAGKTVQADAEAGTTKELAIGLE